MGVGLKPLEFTDCLTDSPYFRENLHYHERELEKTSQQIKRLIKEIKDLLTAAKSKFFFFEYVRSFVRTVEKTRITTAVAHFFFFLNFIS